MPGMCFDRYFRYAELSRFLEDSTAAHPELMRLESLGKSHEGRDIWLATLTCFETGKASDKPALWVDANIHSAELVGSMAALKLIDLLLSGYGHDPEISRCLDSRVFYICPRVNPDGAEWALADTPRLIRSSTRHWPHTIAPPEGLQMQDMDGDGRILTMRIPDPNGPWKPDPAEPRLLTRREPSETGGSYFRLLPEGLFSDYDGITMLAEVRKENLDLNRNFPVRWRPEHQQAGAGPFPASEPEVRVLVDFVANHPNICGSLSLHSYSGVLLRPLSFKPDDKMPAEDRWVFDAIGAKGTALTGYPAVSAYHGFRYHPQEVITGSMDDWVYAELGRFAWTVELWNPRRAAGIEGENFIDWYREHPPEDDYKLLAWSDSALEGKGYVDWYPYEHPQLGRIELGGWNPLYSFWNPPAKQLAAEIAPLVEWMLWHNLISPKLELLELSAKAMGDALWRIRAVVQNTGWLPTDITRLARNKGMVQGLVVEIEPGEGVELLQNERRVKLGQLEGRAHKPSSPNVWAGRPADPTDERVKVEWLVRGTAGQKIRVSARHERAGSCRASLLLGG